jgi:hypothetical protein
VGLKMENKTPIINWCGEECINFENNTNEYFREIKEKFDSMDDEEFTILIDQTIEQTELIGGLTTNIRADIVMKMIEFTENKLWDSIIENCWKNTKRWGDLSDEEKKEWLED